MKTSIEPVLEIDLTAVKHNYNFLKSFGNGVQIACAVKDDAYGIGALDVVRTLKDNCSVFFVAYAKEGELIRSFVPNADIYILQGIGENELSQIIKNHLIPVLSTLEDVQWWTSITDESYALMIETGLNRLGLRTNEINELTISQRKKASLVMSHLACADDTAHPLNKLQLERFQSLKHLFPNAKFSLSASEGFLLGSSYLQDMVRIGALLYGINRSEAFKTNIRPVMSIKAAVLQTAVLPKGEYVSYGATFQAPKDMHLAVISLGYGDGLFRSLGEGKGGFYWHQKRLPILGRICMDSTMCDMAEATDLKPGDFIDVLNSFYTADEMAKDVGTIGYEIISRFGKGQRFQKKIKEA